jgi:hypothetical protein
LLLSSVTSFPSNWIFSASSPISITRSTVFKLSSSVKAYSKVTSWLKENLVNKDDGCHDFGQEEKEDSLNGDNLPMDLTEDDSDQPAPGQLYCHQYH